MLVISIIGIVASYTIPSLVASIDNQTNSARFKKTFSVLSQASIRVLIDNGGSFIGSFVDEDDLRDQFTKYIIVTKKCDDNTGAGLCWHNNYEWQYLNGTLINDNRVTDSRAIMNDNVLLVFDLEDANCTFVDGNLTNICGRIYVDINGFKKPNTVGKDIFRIWIVKNKIVPYGALDDTQINSCTTSDTGIGCASKILKGESY